MGIVVEDVKDLLEGVIVIHDCSVLCDVKAVILELELNVAALAQLLKLFEQSAGVLLLYHDHRHVVKDFVDRLQLREGARLFASMVQRIAESGRSEEIGFSIQVGRGFVSLPIALLFA